jgi:hypothetical protein
MFAGSFLAYILNYYNIIENLQSWFNYHVLCLVDQMRKKQREDFREKYGHTDAAKLDRSFVEKTFGSAKVESEFEDSLTSNIVSLALVDDNNGNYASLRL